MRPILSSRRRKRTKLLVVLGTRPEAIKLAPVILGAQSMPERFDTFVVTTGQHREMLDQVLALFHIRVDVDLGIMKPDQDLCYVTTEGMKGLDRVIGAIRPDCVVVQGDTTTTLVGALTAFYHRVPVAHVEAGLRTYDRYQPFPEEINRRVTSHITEYHFAPTESARRNLLAEGVNPDRIWVTGNTGIDALFLTLEKYGGRDRAADRSGERTVLVTAHRRENHGKPMERICRAVLSLLDTFPDIRFVYPVHMNPQVQRTVFPLLAGHPRVELTDPMDYQAFVLEMNRACLVLTDSGGVQEEAASLGKPVLVLRSKTERPEGAARLVGTDERTIVEEAAALLRDGDADRRFAAANSYGDGKATWRILEVLGRDEPHAVRARERSARVPGAAVQVALA